MVDEEANVSVPRDLEGRVVHRLLNGGAAVRKVGRGVAVSWIRVDGHGKKAEHHRWPNQTRTAPSRGRPVHRNSQPFLTTTSQCQLSDW